MKTPQERLEEVRIEMAQLGVGICLSDPSTSQYLIDAAQHRINFISKLEKRYAELVKANKP